MSDTPLLFMSRREGWLEEARRLKILIGPRHELVERIDRMTSIHAIPDQGGGIDRATPTLWRTQKPKRTA
jgi:hypothetical protein